MSHTLRSSPNKALSPNTTPTGTPTRKQPCCTKCGRPRAGHPRKGCPHVDSGELEKAMSSIELEGSPKPKLELKNLHTKTPEPGWELEDTKAAIRQRRRQSHQPSLPLAPSESLVSIATSSSEVMSILTNPNDYDTDPDDDAPEKKVKKIVHWQEMVGMALSAKKARKSNVKQVMPGTFIPPTPDSSIASVTSSGSEPPPIITYIEPSETPSASSIASSRASIASSLSAQPKALVRASTMSSIERSSFIDTLSSRYKHTTAFLLPKDDITEIERAALKNGFHTRRVTSIETEEHEQMLVVGQDPADTQKLYNTLEGKVKNLADSKERTASSRHSSFGTAAGGMVVGAVAAVTTLAYS